MWASIFVLVVMLLIILWLQAQTGGGLEGDVAKFLLQAMTFINAYLYFIIIVLIYWKIFDVIIVGLMTLFTIGFLIYNKIENDKIHREEQRRREEWKQRN